MLFFFFNDTATTEIYTLSLHDALPIWPPLQPGRSGRVGPERGVLGWRRCLRSIHEWQGLGERRRTTVPRRRGRRVRDRKSTRLNSSHVRISYAVFCLKKKNGDKNAPCA